MLRWIWGYKPLCLRSSNPRFRCRKETKWEAMKCFEPKGSFGGLSLLYSLELLVGQPVALSTKSGLMRIPV